MSEHRFGRRRLLGRGLKASAGAALTRVVGSSGTQKAVDWVKAIREMILMDNTRWVATVKAKGFDPGFSVSPEYVARVGEFIADIQKHVPIDVFVKLRGIGYMSMEYDMWQDMGFEYWEDFARYLADYSQYLR